MTNKTHKTVEVTATLTEQLSAYVEVPIDWTDEQVLDWYKENGANGEFQPLRNGSWTDWEWGDVYSVEGVKPDVTIQPAPDPVLPEYYSHLDDVFHGVQPTPMEKLVTGGSK